MPWSGLSNNHSGFDHISLPGGDLETVFKVVRINDQGKRISMGVTEKDPLSLNDVKAKMVPNLFCVEYLFGRKIDPPKDAPEEALIFAFSKFADAAAYLELRKRQGSHFEIFEAQTEWVKPIEEQCSGSNQNALMTYWNKEPIGAQPTPPGTVMCPWIKLTKLIWKDDKMVAKQDKEAPW